ncbi:MAG TPA: DUF4394 domain-containing protein [Acidimicrobiales bacterium]|nr:DUF4394 domain-containing protein [Acidimicrobiales bacterium]
MLLAALVASVLALVPFSPSSAGAEVSTQGTLGEGYFFVATDGGIFNFGDSEFFGSTGNIALNQPVVDAASTPTGEGYWLVAADGGIFTFGDARFFGSTGDIRLNRPIVGMAPTPSGEGYWLVASDGGIFAFGDAPFLGSTGNITLNKPIVGMASTPSGSGYWMVAEDGGIFTFGDAGFYGSTGGMPLNKPIVGMDAVTDGAGYYLVASDGGIFTFGPAAQPPPFFGSTGNLTLNQPIVDMSLTVTDQGYWLVAADGGIFSFGDAPFLGSTGNLTLNKPVVGMDSTPFSPISAPDFASVLEGEKEAPNPGDPDGGGFALFDFTDDELCYAYLVNNVDGATAAHIHRGAAGIAGPVVIPLSPPDEDGLAVDCVPVASTLVDEIMAYPQGFYVNVHSGAFPGGAVRGQLAGETVVASTEDNELVVFDSEAPMAIAPPVPVTGLTTGTNEVIEGLDFRPANDQLYALTVDDASIGRIYRVSEQGVATRVGTTDIDLTGATTFGFDFNPVVDRIRIVSDAADNLRVNPDTGEVTVDSALSATGVEAAAYSENRAGAATTTLYDIDPDTDVLAVQNPPNDGTLTTVGSLGIDAVSAVGFDIAPSPIGVPGTALVLSATATDDEAHAWAVNLATGAVTDLGVVGVQPASAVLFTAMAIA